MSLRVVNLGLPKTGTTTLARALKMAGFKVADHRVRPKQTTVKSLHNQYVAELLYRGYFETGDPGAHLDPFECVSEISLLREGKSLWPQMDFGLIEAIRSHHPGVKFLASNRDPFQLSQSMLAWSDLGVARLPQAAIPGLPEGYGETTKQREQWISAHYAHLRAIFAGRDDFLEYDVADADARDRISTFLGVPLPWWGRVNSNSNKKAS
tara:strand:+ start:12922 stop:13548 length:627 start_codon:yes stop_codon:yes gene_type:complete